MAAALARPIASMRDGPPRICFEFRKGDAAGLPELLRHALEPREGGFEAFDGLGPLFGESTPIPM